MLFGALSVFNYYANNVADNPVGTVGNHAGNLYNDGLFCEYDGKVYFSNPYDENTMYVMNSDESEIKKLGTVGVNSINAAGKYIYYYQNSIGDGSGLGYAVKTTGMYRMTNNGKDYLCLKRDPVGSLLLIDNDVYYQHFDSSEGVSLDRISTDKESETANVLAGVITPASAVDSVLYFADPENNFYLYSYDTRYGSKSCILSRRVYNPVYHSDGYIYYMDIDSTYEIHRFNPFTAEVERLSTDRAETFNVYGNMIYYQTNSSQPALMRMQTDGYGLEVVAYGMFENINITSNYVYYNEYGSPTPVYKQSLYGPVSTAIFNPGL